MVKKNIDIVVLLLVILGLVFYWYSYRSVSIVSACSFEAQEKAIKKSKDNGSADGQFTANDRDTYYGWCLQEKGLIQ